MTWKESAAVFVYLLEQVCVVLEVLLPLWVAGYTQRVVCFFILIHTALFGWLAQGVIVNNWGG